MVYWPTVIRILDTSKGIIGIVINVAVIFLLWRRGYGANLLACRISITLTSMQGLLYSAVTPAFMNVVHIFHYDRAIAVVYGSLLAYQHESYSYYLAGFSIVVMFLMWELIPGACLLQYFNLRKPHLSVAQRIMMSYAPCLAMAVWTLPFFSAFYSTHDSDELVRNIHAPRASDPFLTVATLFTTTEEHPFSMIHASIIFMIPTVVISYGTFAFCFARSRDILATATIKLSTKTLLMHNRFLTLMLVQNLLPMVVVSVPIAIFFFALFTGLFSMGLMTLPVSFTLWTLPIVQGSVALSFVLRLKKRAVIDRMRSSHNAS